ncbi:ATP-dependent DNA helicase pfh1 [Holothuria leucospilota]|uniref:ATP-dependent DNA helicase n=1 Tax=Holothuria leucospilota TaxID=206669 RepID=A0A9Q1C8W7_HOLLE|nr:ATP-dependent DNA helicase pfh1 [Holothuria leucospilota]
MEAEIISTAEQGHNFFLLGQPGTGKTYLIQKIEQRLTAGNKRVQVTASTGLAAASLKGRTVHAFFGISDGRYSNDTIIEKIKNNVDFKVVKDRITQTDSLIIDEVSMLSRKIFMQIEAVSRAVRGKEVPFGGIQVILVGDFYQLKPVPNLNYGDPGEVILMEETLKTLIPHHFVLMEVHRQSEQDLVNAVSELSKGLKCSAKTLETLKELERPLPPGKKPVKLFALKYDVEKHNWSVCWR